ncbi:MAG: hypothetical protein H0T56_11125 [Pseudaminobacter sp.]|nr:hypothetical protein [Pseudaminobacter sp.]
MTRASTQKNGPASVRALPDRGSTNPLKGKQMNAHSDITTEPETATIEQLAAIDFEAWQHHDDEWKPPSNADWCRLTNPHLVSVRMGWFCLFKGKDDLVDMLRDLEPAEEMHRGIAGAIAFLKPMLLVLEAADSRLEIADAALAMKGAVRVMIATTLSETVSAYRAALLDYNENSPDASEQADAYADQTYGPWLSALGEWDSPAETREDAVAALKMALMEAEGFYSTGPVEPMIRAALGFLEGKRNG